MNQKQFEQTIKEFKKIEDARDQLWDRARKMIKARFEIEAYVLILATWNFARFRYFMKNFDLQKFREIIGKVNPVFDRIKNKQFKNIDFTDVNLITDIKFIYDQLRKIAEQTGASKIMALKNPGLFVMWDTEIRNIYRKKYKGEYAISNGESSKNYINFLKAMADEFGNLKSNDKNVPFAKAIDEYNYVQADKIREKRKMER